MIKVLPRNKKPEDFSFGPPTTVVAVTRTAILTEESPVWIQASRVKKVPDHPRGKDHPPEVLTGVDNPDLQRVDSEVPEGTHRPHLQPEHPDDQDKGHDVVGDFWTMVDS